MTRFGVIRRAAEYLAYACDRHPAPSHWTRIGCRTEHAHAIRALSRAKLIERVPGYTGQHWVPTALGLELSRAGAVLSALL